MNNRNSLSAIILSRTGTVPDRLLNSVSFAQQRVVLVDSPDKNQKNIKGIVYLYHPLGDDFSSHRNYALSAAKGEWVFFLDEDEYPGTELIREIKEKINDGKTDAYFIPRQDVVYHQVLRHGETGKTRIIRLAKKNAGKFVRPVHEYWKIKGRVGEISSPLFHQKDHFVSGFISRMAQYSQIDAPMLEKENKPFSVFRLLMNPLLKFVNNYLYKGGILDGVPGLFLSYLMSIQSLSVRVFQWTNKNLS